MPTAVLLSGGLDSAVLVAEETVRDVAHPIEVDGPYARVGKAEVVRRGAARGVPLALTLSCMNPQGGWEPFANTAKGSRPPFVHCGVCSKCRERHDAFLEAGVTDPTAY